LFENANDIIYTIDLAGNFTSLNQTGERLTGYQRAEALRMNITEVVAPEQLGIVRENLARKIESQDTSSVYETEIITKSRQRLPLELSSRLIYRDGKPVGVQGIARDITERKQVQGDETIRDLYQGIVKQDVKSIMYVGVTVGDELLGAFALSTTKQMRRWSEADIEVAKAAADQSGIAIRQARLYQKAAATSMRE